jgi:hypothetical protein
MIEQSYGRYIRKDFLGPLIAARPKGLRAAAAGGKPAPQRGYGKKARIYYRIVVEAGASALGKNDPQIQAIFPERLLRYPHIYPQFSALEFGFVQEKILTIHLVDLRVVCS